MALIHQNAQTSAGVLQRPIHMRAVFKKPPTNYTSVERLLNVKVDKTMFWFDFCFPKATETANSKLTGWRSSELIVYEMRSLMQKKCATLITKHQSPKACQHFLLFLLVIFLWICQVPIEKIA